MTHRFLLASCRRLFAPSLLAPLLLPAALQAQNWIAPTAEELAMTSIAEVPGAAAVYLNKDETTEDQMHAFSYYVRLKVLTDKGKEYANVELPYVNGESSSTVDSIAGRTIHPDGTIIPFTGKPYDKLIGKEGGYKFKSKVFTLPSVEIGSIIEYRYKIHIDDNHFREPDWYIQSDLYTRKAHYSWRPTGQKLYNEKGDLVSGRIAWAPILPVGAEIQQPKNPDGQLQFELNVHDIPPRPTEDYMPPVGSVSYRVLFYYTPYRTREEFWDVAGKRWAKDADKFIGPGKEVKNYVATLLAPGDNEDQKARKLYAAVMSMENTDFTRERTHREERSEGFKEVKSSEDVLRRSRGSSDQLTQLFVAMVRAAGMRAYLMGVADRDQRLFVPMYLNLRQIDDYIAIVNINGKEVFFDPGERYCEPEHLSWRHTLNGGIRQTDQGTALGQAPGESYISEHVSRVADLKLDEHGEATGTVTLAWNGDPALHWRQLALRGDETSLKEELRTTLEHILPGGMEVKVADIQNIADYDKVLKVKYEVKGAVGSPTGKRLLVPADIFLANEKPLFSEPKREVAVDMHYASQTQDAVRFTFPAGLAVESAPETDTQTMPKSAAFDVHVKRDATSITTYRNLTIGRALFLPHEYDELKAFYAKLETKDQETLVLTHVAPGATSTAATRPSGN